MRRSTDFTSVVRAGRRVRDGRIVVHHSSGSPDTDGSHIDAGAQPPPLVGLIVSKSVGGSVVRHQLSRRLRAELRRRLGVLPDGSRTVVRALPEAGTATSAELGSQLDRALARVTRAPQMSRPANPSSRSYRSSTPPLLSSE